MVAENGTIKTVANQMIDRMVAAVATISFAPDA